MEKYKQFSSRIIIRKLYNSHLKQLYLKQTKDRISTRRKLQSMNIKIEF